jgi:glycogen synthase
MMEALKRAFCMYTDTEKMQKMIINVMRADFSWKKSAQRYKEVYQTALRKKAA